MKKNKNKTTIIFLKKRVLAAITAGAVVIGGSGIVNYLLHRNNNDEHNHDEHNQLEQEHNSVITDNQVIIDDEIIDIDPNNNIDIHDIDDNILPSEEETSDSLDHQDNSIVNDIPNNTDDVVNPINPVITETEKSEVVSEPSNPSDNDSIIKDTDGKPNENDTQSVHHIHSYGVWYSVDDEHERRDCVKGDDYQLRNHKYSIHMESIVDNHNGTHTIKIIDRCSTCGHSKMTTKTESCTFSSLEYNNREEYKTCSECGHKHVIGAHSLDAGTINGDTITYRCTNPGCGYSKTESYTKPHTHSYGEWYSVDDEHERRDCVKGDDHQLRNHSYSIQSKTASDNHNGTHTITTVEKCSTCGHSKTTTKTEGCTYGSLQYDANQEYKVCSECGHKHVIGAHSLDAGTINGDTITYRCTNPGCGYSKTESYTADWTAWTYLDDNTEQRTDRNSGRTETRSHGGWSVSTDTYTNLTEETHTHIVRETCSTCGHTRDKVNETTAHGSWSTISSSVTTYTHKEKCDECGYIKTVVDTPEVPPLPFGYVDDKAGKVLTLVPKNKRSC